MPVDNSVNIMSYSGSGQSRAELALGHVGLREFRRALLARLDLIPKNLDLINEPRYEYAIFRDDESVVFNVRPDDTGAKPVTIIYSGPGVEQL